MAHVVAERQSAPHAGLLYHYTNQEGLLGIIQSSALWATSIHYLNDELEYKYAIEVAEDSFRKKEKQLASKGVKCFLEMARKWLKSSERISIYVASFSELGDLLSQWRAYSRGGPGFSLGFSHKKLSELAAQHKLRLGRCIYYEPLQVKLLDALIDSALAGLPQVESKDSQSLEQALRPAVRSYYLGFLRLAPLIKDPGFSEECEWRLFSRPTSANDERVFVRAGKKYLIPTIELSLRDDQEEASIAEVIVGPSEYKRLSFDALWVLSAKGSTKIASFTHSTIPYRG